MAPLRTLEDYRGLGSADGLAVAGEAHLRQSIRDILLTPIGSRVMNRAYGSNAPALLDAPMNPGTVADLVAATAEALYAWEPRVTLKRVVVVAAEAGRLGLDLLLVANGRPLKLERVV